MIRNINKRDLIELYCRMKIKKMKKLIFIKDTDFIQMMIWMKIIISIIRKKKLLEKSY
jgi:hypothetical protein